jgi:hypothetical protein
MKWRLSYVISHCEKTTHLPLYTYIVHPIMCIDEEEFEDTKGVIRIRISKKNRQHNGKKKKYKRTNNDLQNIHIQLKIE